MSLITNTAQVFTLSKLRVRLVYGFKSKDANLTPIPDLNHTTTQDPQGKPEINNHGTKKNGTDKTRSWENAIKF